MNNKGTLRNLLNMLDSKTDIVIFDSDNNNQPLYEGDIMSLIVLSAHQKYHKEFLGINLNYEEYVVNDIMVFDGAMHIKVSNYYHWGEK